MGGSIATFDYRRVSSLTRFIYSKFTNKMENIKITIVETMLSSKNGEQDEHYQLFLV